MEHRIREPSANAASPLGMVPNRYRFADRTRWVDIDVGTIHSAKGQTHTATLVFETYYKKHDLSDLLDWISGKNRGARSGEGIERKERMRLIYTAMTRPTHLLCMAMRQDAVESGADSDVLIKRLGAIGWKVRRL